MRFALFVAIGVFLTSPAMAQLQVPPQFAGQNIVCWGDGELKPSASPRRALTQRGALASKHTAMHCRSLTTSNAGQAATRATIPTMYAKPFADEARQRGMDAAVRQGRALVAVRAGSDGHTYDVSDCVLDPAGPPPTSHGCFHCCALACRSVLSLLT
jgi:hypothetical protein